MATVGERSRLPRITVDLESVHFHRALKILAASRGQSIRDLVNEALREWLHRQEDLEDLRDFLEVEGETSRPFNEFLRDLGKKR